MKKSRFVVKGLDPICCKILESGSIKLAKMHGTTPEEACNAIVNTALRDYLNSVPTKLKAPTCTKRTLKNSDVQYVLTVNQELDGVFWKLAKDANIEHPADILSACFVDAVRNLCLPGHPRANDLRALWSAMKVQVFKE